MPPTVPSTASAAGAVPAQRRRRARAPQPSAPLGSLTQRGALDPGACPTCGGSHLTTLSMTLPDGTPVRFTSCRNCEHRRWDADGAELSIDVVLDRSRKTS